MRTSLKSKIENNHKFTHTQNKIEVRTRATMCSLYCNRSRRTGRSYASLDSSTAVKLRPLPHNHKHSHPKNTNVNSVSGIITIIVLLSFFSVGLHDLFYCVEEAKVRKKIK